MNMSINSGRIEETPRKVMPMKDGTGEVIGAYCPCCGRALMKKFPSWGYKSCTLCGQPLDWDPVMRRVEDED